MRTRGGRGKAGRSKSCRGLERLREAGLKTCWSMTMASVLRGSRIDARDGIVSEYDAMPRALAWREILLGYFIAG